MDDYLGYHSLTMQCNEISYDPVIL